MSNCLPLPVILYTDKGIGVFSSEKLGLHHEEGHEGANLQRQALQLRKLEDKKILAVTEAGEVDKDVQNI
jgi:F-type H+-transporting ATPase subunit a